MQLVITFLGNLCYMLGFLAGFSKLLAGTSLVAAALFGFEVYFIGLASILGVILAILLIAHLLGFEYVPDKKKV